MCSVLVFSSESETDSAGDSGTEIGAIYLPQQTTEGTEKTYKG